LAHAVREKKNPVLVGLDPRGEMLPNVFFGEDERPSIEEMAAAYFVFCRGVIDVVAPLVPAVKPQAAFFEQLGAYGMVALSQIIDYAREKGLLVILDGKRNDIGSTATAYANGYLGDDSPWGADALTVSPYLGGDSLDPFVDAAVERDAGIFVLVKTSNPGGGMFQDLTADGRPLFEHVADYVEKLAGETTDEDAPEDAAYGAVGAVVGATYPEQLVELRAKMPHAWLLIPGFGSQGGTAADVAGGFASSGLGAIVNNSRGIIFAHARPEYAEKFGDAKWQEAIEAATLAMIEQLKADTPAGKL
jgi:orotidine-5'-phosphate decarboxylase